MANLELLTSSLFEDHYNVVARVIMCHDNVHRKNKDFGLQSLEKSGFAKFILSLLDKIPETCVREIMGDVTLQNKTVEEFCMKFLSTNCKHYTMYHDEKMCTVEFTCKFTTTVGNLKQIDDEILKQIHLEVETPVGKAQI